MAGKKSNPKKEWKKLTGAIEAGLRRGSWVDIWESAGEIVERKLFKAGGYKSPNDFFERHMKVDRAVAARNVRLAKYASLDDDQTLGREVMDALLDYLEARHGKIKGRLPVALDKIRIPVVRFGEEERAMLSDVTVADLEAATAKMKA